MLWKAREDSQGMGLFLCDPAEGLTGRREAIGSPLSHHEKTFCRALGAEARFPVMEK